MSVAQNSIIFATDPHHSSMPDNIPFGKEGENKAAAYLQKQGYRIIERNFTKRYGEIDIIAIDGDTLVFVEVKTRIGDGYGRPIEAITPWKLKSLIKSAEYYKSLHPELPDPMRIDFVGITFDKEGAPQIELVKNITG